MGFDAIVCIMRKRCTIDKIQGPFEEILHGLLQRLTHMYLVLGSSGQYYYICTTSYYQNTLQNGLEKTLTSSRHFLIETMSNKSTKSVSSKRPNQKGIGSPNPDIKIVDTSRTTSRGTSLVGAEPVEEVHPQYTNEPLRMRIEYK